MPRRAALVSLTFLLAAAAAAAANGVDPLSPGPIPIDFVLFSATLAGVALLHRHSLSIALGGLAVISIWKIGFSPFAEGAGATGWIAHLGTEWVMLANLLGLLLGFALLSKHFEASRVPDWLPTLLPDDWKGGLVLLFMTFLLSSCLDNIAGALIGGTMARALFRDRVHIGYLAAIVAAANAGGAGCVLGDTTTTMIWIDGVNPLQVLHAYIGAGTALLVFAIPAALQQQRHSPIRHRAPRGVSVDWARVSIVGLTLATVIGVNILVNLRYQGLSNRFPFTGAAVWAALLVCAPLRPPAWSKLRNALTATIFLLSLVLTASMMPV